jgi:hypothetical protein
MDTMQSKVIGAGLFYLFIFLSGFWLSHLGKPYPTIVFSIHKLIGVATAIFLVITVYRIHQAAPLSPVEITAGVVTVLFFAGTIVAGGLLSIDKSMPAAVLTMHQVAPFLTMLSTAATLYLVLSRTS